MTPTGSNLVWGLDPQEYAAAAETTCHGRIITTIRPSDAAAEAKALEILKEDAATADAKLRTKGKALGSPTFYANRRRSGSVSYGWVASEK